MQEKEKEERMQRMQPRRQQRQVMGMSRTAMQRCVCVRGEVGVICSMCV